MAVTKKRLATCLERYDQCLLEENFQNADMLAKALCCEKGLWTAFCKGVITNHGRTTRGQIRINILKFLSGQAQTALKLCKQGMNRFHDLYVAMEACRYFIIVFHGDKPHYELAGNIKRISMQDLNMALGATHTVLGIDGKELHLLAIKFGKELVEHCRMGQVIYVHYLVTLGSEYDLDIRDLESNTEEVQQWLFAADLKVANNAYADLLREPLPTLMADMENTAKRLQILADCLDPDSALLCEEGGSWFMRSRPITAADLNLKPEDFEYLSRLQREFETRA